jgi:hypothetical protein
MCQGVYLRDGASFYPSGENSASELKRQLGFGSPVFLLIPQPGNVCTYPRTGTKSPKCISTIVPLTG